MRQLRGDHCQCAACLEYFNSTAAFDKHRTGDHGSDARRCLTPDEMVQRKMAKNDGDWWVTERADSRTGPPRRTASLNS